MTEDLETYAKVANPLDLIARFGDLSEGPVNALLDRRNPRLTWVLADNAELRPEIRELVLDHLLDPARVGGCGEDARVALARQRGLTPAQRRRLVQAPGLPVAALAGLVAGGPDHGVREVVVAHLAKVAGAPAVAATDGARRPGTRQAAVAERGVDPVALAVAVGAGWDEHRVQAFALLGEVSGVLALLEQDATALDVAELVAGFPFRPASFAAGMAGLLRWPAAAEVLEPGTVDGLACIAAVAGDAEIHRRALRVSWNRFESSRTTDAQRIAESLATNPALRAEEAEELVRLRDVLQDGYLDDWYPVPGDGSRVDQMTAAADHVRVLRVAASRPRLAHRNVWAVAAVALATKSQRLRAAAIEAVRDTRREGLDRTTLAWLAGRLGVTVAELVARQAAMPQHDRPVADRPSVAALRDADELQYLMGVDYDTWSALAVLCETSPRPDLFALAHVAMGIVGVDDRAGSVR